MSGFMRRYFVMRWSWKIGKVAGIGIHLHATFLVLLAWVGVDAFSERRQWGDLFEGWGFILALFCIVVLHELGHALTARRFGIRTRDITLLPIGGVARLERLPEEPRQEMLVALAGPAVNLALAVFFFAILGGARELARLTGIQIDGAPFLATLIWVNLGLAFFNLLPAFPMDGGRVLRAFLARRLNYARATNIAATIGQFLALLMGFAGLCSLFGLLGSFSNPFLMLIGLFVWVAAGQEASHVRMKSALGGLTVSQVMITQFHAVSPQEPLGWAAQLLLAGWQQDFPVVECGRLVGLLTRGALVDGLAQRGPQTPIAEVMARQFPSVSPGQRVEDALPRLRDAQGRSLMVVNDGQLLGILAGGTVGDYLLVQGALRGPSQPQKCPLGLAQRPTG